MSHLNRAALMSGTAIALLALPLATATAQDEATATDEPDAMASMESMEPGLRVSGAWTRESPMVALAGAAYLVIHNDTDADDALVGASSPAAGTVELHLSSMDDEGLMSMNQVAEIPIPAHADAVLEPGGYHIMLIDLVEPLTEGTDVELELEFMTAEPQTVTAPVMASAPMTEGMEMKDESEAMGDAAEEMEDPGETMEADEG